MKYILASLAAWTVAASPATAQRFCQRPEQPSCIVLMIGGDQTEFQLCRMRMVDFQNSVNEYVKCLRDEQNDIIQILNSTISRFNACASGGC